MRGIVFLVIVIVVTLIDLLVPYLLIGEQARFAASYLFWCALTIVVIGLGISATSRWGRSR